MEFIASAVPKNKIRQLQSVFGDYAKITMDLNKEVIVIGCELHADGETVLLEKGSQQDDIWGGGINFKTREIDTTAVMNIRPGLNNNSLEILDPERREKFTRVVRKLFSILWET